MFLQVRVLVGLSIFSACAFAVEYVTANGDRFVGQTTGQEFPIIGVDYQPGGSSGFSLQADPLSDANSCLRDAILLQNLGINTVRIYNLSPNLDHNQCVSIFNAAGIYLIIDVNSGLGGQYMDRSDPVSTYSLEYLEHIFGLVEAFSQYPNLLGFFAANEIINEESAHNAPLYVRAVVRDLKDYIAKHAPRPIGVGYSAADVANLLQDSWAYLSCRLENAPLSKIDFFGLNDYEWCGESSYVQSGYSNLVSMFSGTDVPVFFSEYGCNKVEPRTFSNVPVLYGDEMRVLTGGLVYEFTQEISNYGLVATNSSSEVVLLQDFNFLKHALGELHMAALTTEHKAAATMTEIPCATGVATGPGFYHDWDLPPRPSGADKMISSGLRSAMRGSLVNVTATVMPATVYNFTGAQVTGLSLVSLGPEDSNYPGVVDNYTVTGQSSSPSEPTESSSAHHGDDGGGVSGDDENGVVKLQANTCTVIIIGAVCFALLGSPAIL